MQGKQGQMRSEGRRCPSKLWETVCRIGRNRMEPVLLAISQERQADIHLATCVLERTSAG